MEKLERRMRQTLIKVDERVTEKLKKLQQKLMEVDQRASKNTEEAITKTVEQVQQTLIKVDERVTNALRHALGLGDRLGPLPCRGDRPVALDAARALRMDMASCYAPHHGEDASFVHSDPHVVGVADGVGSVRKTGVDAGAFARALMTNAFVGAAELAAGGEPVCPSALLQRAYEEAARSRTPGASTAVIVSLHGTTLRWAYVGDSAFAVLRGGKILYRSEPQQHRFNHPYQLCSGGSDGVADAAAGEMAVAADDVVVVGTDGLFDNVFDVDLECLVRNGTELGFSPQNMANNIACTAYEMSRRRSGHSPFSIQSWRDDEEGAKRFYGGKLDDITVVVAFIVSQSDS